MREWVSLLYVWKYICHYQRSELFLYFQLIAFQAFCGIGFGCAIQMLVYGGQTIAYCKNEPAERCVGDVMGILTSNAAEVAIGCVYLVITGANYVLYGLIARQLKCQAKLADSDGCQMYGSVKE